jgi:hypothetical protein
MFNVAVPRDRVTVQSPLVKPSTSSMHGWTLRSS